MWASAKRAHLHPRFAKSPGKHQPTTVVGLHSRPRSGPPIFRLLRSLHALRVTGEMRDRSPRYMPQTVTKALDKTEGTGGDSRWAFTATAAWLTTPRWPISRSPNCS